MTKIMAGTINLRNFFVYYKDGLDHHVGAVEKLYEDLKRDAPHLLDGDSEWVRIYRDQVETPSPVSKVGLDSSKSLKVSMRFVLTAWFMLIMILSVEDFPLPLVMDPPRQ